MNLTVISASNRAGSQSRKVSDRVIEKLRAIGAEAALIDLHELDMPLFNADNQPDNWDVTADTIQSSDGFVLVVPEWNGMAPPAILNFLSFVNKKDMAHKPVLLVGVSAGMNGAYPLAELKAFGQKNRHFTLMPDHLIVKQAEDVLNSSEPNTDSEADNHLHDRFDYELRVLNLYAQKLQEIRSSAVIDLDKFPNGV